MYRAILLAFLVQRIGFPFGEEIAPVSPIIVAVAVVAVCIRARARVSAIGASVWLGLLVIGLIGLLRYQESSELSLLLLLLTYVPILFLTASSSAPALGTQALGALRATIHAALIGSAFALVQAAYQWVVEPVLWDPVAMYTPGLLRQGFNDTYTLSPNAGAFGLSVKPNGVIFPEPSFLSLYCALALVFLLFTTGSRSWGRRRLLVSLGVLCAGLVLSVSTSGLPIIAAAGLVALRSLLSLRNVIAAIPLVALALWSGVLGPIIAKATEGFRPTTSTGLRLTVPYQLLTDDFLENPVFGSGPGSASQLSELALYPGLQVPTLYKLGIEYGLFAVAMVALLLMFLFRGSRRANSAPLLAACFVAWVLPAEALLNPLLVVLLLFACANLTWRERSPDAAPSDAGVLEAPGRDTNRTTLDIEDPAVP